MASGRRFAVVTPKVVPGEGVEPSSPTPRSRIFAKVKPVGESPNHDLVRDFYADNASGGRTPWDFRCDDPNCIPVDIDGVWHHAWFCSWWHLPENKTKTPF